MSEDITLDLNEAAAFLKMSPEALRRKAKAGEIPGAKIGKQWCFFKHDLVAYLRSGYALSRQASQSGEEVAVCHSTDERRPGGSALPPPADSEYAAQLGLEVGNTPKNSTTDSKQPTGSVNNLARSQNGNGKMWRSAGYRKRRTRRQ